MQALRLTVLRSNSIDCTNNGISANADNLALVGVIGKDKVFRPISGTMPATDPSLPQVALRAGNGDTVNIVPVGPAEDGTWLMAGGNFAHTSDSRLSAYFDALDRPKFYGAIAIHDRIES